MSINKLSNTLLNVFFISSFCYDNKNKKIIKILLKTLRKIITFLDSVKYL